MRHVQGNMASTGKLSTKLLQFKVHSSLFRQFYNLPKSNVNVLRVVSTTFVCVAGAGAAFYAAHKLGKLNTVHAFKSKKREPDDLVRAVKLTSRERRFIKFASVEYDGQLYMTPQDFLESVVEQEPRPRLKRRQLTNKDLDMIRDATPHLNQGSSQMFRNLRDKGIISYTEYLFLLSILTKPQTGFRIAFNMFDTDGNERVDKNEFLVIRRLMGGTLMHERDTDEETKQLVSCDVCLC